MTDGQMRRELSKEYLAWTRTPDLNICPAVEEVQRLCEVIVGLRAELVALALATRKRKRP